MNCKNFEATISDLARASVMDAGARQGALSHVSECDRCAALLEAERALTQSLRALAASDETIGAPAHLEASLLAKFGERAAATQQNRVVPMPQRPSRWSGIRTQAVAAAVLLMFAVGGAITLRLREARTPVASKPDSVASNNNRREISAAPVNQAAPPAIEDRGQEGTTTAIASNENPEIKSRPIRYSGREARILRDGLNVPSSRIKEAVKTPTSSEIATDFMPVSYGDNLNEIDEGRIVRVEMPRSALAQFGLPVNMERANERVKADVLLGDDGMARAIRFVR